MRPVDQAQPAHGHRRPAWLTSTCSPCTKYNDTAMYTAPVTPRDFHLRCKSMLTSVYGQGSSNRVGPIQQPHTHGWSPASATGAMPYGMQQIHKQTGYCTVSIGPESSRTRHAIPQQSNGKWVRCSFSNNPARDRRGTSAFHAECVIHDMPCYQRSVVTRPEGMTRASYTTRHRKQYESCTRRKTTQAGPFAVPKSTKRRR